MKKLKLKTVDNLKTEHECEEHWNLRRIFLLAHKEKFEIDRLLCLAQVFINVEMLGCRYPQETMELVASLSADIPEVQSFREKREGKLKRTFVQASDAAETRAKGLKIRKTASSILEGPSFVKSSSTITQGDFLKDDSGTEQIVSSVNNPFEGIIIMEYKELPEQYTETIQRTLMYSGYTTNNLYEISNLPNGTYSCSIVWQRKTICSVENFKSAKTAKSAASKKLMDLMKQHCYTIQTLVRYVASTTIEKSSTTNAKDDSNTVAPLSAENKGNKMLKMMGWSGGGLGKDAQGIVDPISASQSVNRSGLGLEKLTIKQSMHKIRSLLDQFIADGSAFDLAFAPDFSKEERAEIHKFVRRNHQLKSKSYGNDNERKLIVSKNQRPADILAMLLRAGGSTEKYNLVPPTLKAPETE